MNDFAKAAKDNLDNLNRNPTYPIWVSVADHLHPRHGDTLCFESDFEQFEQTDRLATKNEYENGDRAVGSIFEALNPGDCIRLKEGKFRLDGNLDISSKFVIVELTVKEIIESAWRGQTLAE